MGAQGTSPTVDFRLEQLDSVVPWRSIAYGNSYFVAVTDIANSSLSFATISNNGTKWFEPPTPALPLRGITFGPNTFVAVGPAGAVMTSTNATTWTQRNAASVRDWNSVAFGNDLFVAVASSGDTNRIMTSNDGITWTSRTAPSTDSWVSVTYNVVWAAVSTQGTIMTSQNGTTGWALATSPVHPWTSVACGSGGFVAVASDGTIARSELGNTWSVVTQFSQPWSGVTFGNGIFVAVATDGSIATSPDGQEWTLKTSPVSSALAVTTGNGLIIAVGNDVDIAVAGAPVSTVISNANVVAGPQTVYGTTFVNASLDGSSTRLLNLFGTGTIGPSPDYYAVDVNPNFSSNTNNQVVAMLRIRDRGINIGGSTGQRRPLLISENAGGGQYSVNLFETGLIIGRSTSGLLSIINPAANFQSFGFSDAIPNFQGHAFSNTGNGRNGATTFQVFPTGDLRARDLSPGLNASISPGMTAGFTYIPAASGAPTGNPTSPVTGTVPMYYDTSNHRLYIQSGVQWRSVALTL